MRVGTLPSSSKLSLRLSSIPNLSLRLRLILGLILGPRSNEVELALRVNPILLSVFSEVLQLRRFQRGGTRLIRYRSCMTRCQQE